MKDQYFVTFILSELYYLPVYEPVAQALKKQNLDCLFLVRSVYKKRTINTDKTAIAYLREKDYDFKILEEDLSAISTTYVISSANGYKTYDFKFKHTVLMSHGIGTKGGYFAKEHTLFDIRFIEGDYRMTTMLELFPDIKTKLYNVGFSKLDTAINMTNKDKSRLILRYGLDPKKKTILYSPTFYPSTIERIKRAFPSDFSNYNIIIKPHAFSYEMDKYKKQRRLLKHWKKSPNVYLAPPEEFNLSPIMAISDVMVTDESSAMFEFIALDKPMICYRDVKLRLTYRLFKNKLKKRMEPHLIQFKDSFTNAYSYPQLVSMVADAINTPERNSDTRQKMTSLLVGKTDGKVSERIVEHLLGFINKNK